MSAALFNMMCVVACGPGNIYASDYAVCAFPGHSMIIDYHGALIQRVNYPGEIVTGAAINIEALRKRRTDPKYNSLTQIRAEVYQQMYAKEIYPMNLFLNRLPTDPEERSNAQPIKRWLKERIFIPPEK